VQLGARFRWGEGAAQALWRRCRGSSASRSGWRIVPCRGALLLIQKERFCETNPICLNFASSKHIKYD
jgi:hypothetical protein